MEAAPHPWPTLGVLLMRDGLVTKEDLEAILAEQRDSRQQRITGRRLGELLIERGIVSQDQVTRLVAEQYELPFVELEESDIDPKVASVLTEELARRYSALPISFFPDGSILLAIADPSTVIFSDELRRVLGAPLRFTVAGPEAIDAAIAFVYAHPNPHGRTDAEAAADGVTAQPPNGPTPEEPRDNPYLGVQRAVAHLWPPLGALLIRERLVSDAQLEAALAQQRLSASRRLGEILVERGIVTGADVARLVAEQYELPFIDLAATEVDPRVTTLLPEDLARQYSALPIGFLPDGSLRVVVADPTNVLYSDELHRALGVPLSFAVAAPTAIEATIAAASTQVPTIAASDVETPVVEQGHEVAVEDEDGWFSVDDAADEPPDEPVRILAVADDVTAASVDNEVAAMVDVPELYAVEDVAEDAAEIVPMEEDFEADAAVQIAYAEDTNAEPVVAELALVEKTTEVDGVEDASGTILAEAPEFDRVDEISAEEQIDDVVATPETPTTEESPVAAADLDDVLERAISLGASTIHLSPQPRGIVVRARVDGVLRELATIATSDPVTVTTRLHTDQYGTAFSIHVLETKHGDRMTLRTRGDVAAPLPLTGLGMAPDDEAALRTAIQQPSGAILVCGPTESGKTTTLYAALQALNTRERALATIEDPVTHVLPGVDQVEVDMLAGRTFVRGLEAVLRSDSDVVLVGEIRDEETAAISLRASLSGRLVLAALHAQSAAAAVRRLVDLGIPPGLLGTTLTCVVAQRLARRVCSDCRETYYATEDELAELGRLKTDNGPRLLARGRGCAACSETGYRGRVGIFEILPLTDTIRTLVARGASTTEISEAALTTGMRTLHKDGVRLCLEGVTTAAEVQRVTGTA